jgi:flagellar motor switch protein FliM
LTPEEIAALTAEVPYVPAPVERFRVLVDAGHTDMTPGEVSALKPGDVIPLSRAAGEPMEIVANAVTVALGELVEVRGRAAVRVVSVARSTTPSGRTPR